VAVPGIRVSATPAAMCGCGPLHDLRDAASSKMEVESRAPTFRIRRYGTCKARGFSGSRCLLEVAPSGDELLLFSIQ
jgi:hypothetical protein